MGVVNILPLDSFYHQGNTWRILEEELSLIQESYRDLECMLMGDFQAYTSMEAEIPDVLIQDLSDFVSICCRIPRSNED